MTTVPTTTLSDKDLDLITRFHGHVCPMVLLGARTAMEASRRVGERQDLFGFYRGYGCALDGVQLYSGCTWGNQNLVLLRGGDFSFILAAEDSGKGVLVLPKKELLDEIRGDKTPEIKDALMTRLRGGDPADLFDFNEVADLDALTRFPGV